MTNKEKLLILAEQEKTLVFDKFTNYDALLLGKALADKLIESERPIAIIVRIGNYQVFSYTMKGKEESHFGWANRKANLVEKIGHSSMYGRIAYMESHEYADLVKQEDIYAIGCGGFPIATKDKGIVGVVALSGLVDPEDHNVIVETLSEIIGKRVDLVSTL